MPIVSWTSDFAIDGQPILAGVDRSLRALGNLVDSGFEFTEYTPAEFHLDGTIEFLERPQGADPASVFRVSPSGYALGHASIPGSVG